MLLSLFSVDAVMQSRITMVAFSWLDVRKITSTDNIWTASFHSCGTYAKRITVNLAPADAIEGHITPGELFLSDPCQRVNEVLPAMVE